MVISGDPAGKAAAFRFGSVLIHDLRCSNSCVFCRAGDRSLPEDLTRAGEARLHRETVDLLRRGIGNLNVSGSEPLKYSRIVAYLRWARPLFRKITLLDPGNRLHDEAFAREVAGTGVDVFVIHLYGSRAPVHNRCVSNAAAFGQVTKGISNLQRFKGQVATPTCGSCSLAREDICGGILRMHYEANRDFDYRGLSKNTFKVVKSILRVQRVTP